MGNAPEDIQDNSGSGERYKELDTLLGDRNDSRYNRNSFCHKFINCAKFVFYEVKNNILVYLLCIVYLMVCVMNKVFAKRAMDVMSNYSFVVSEVHNIICVNVFFLVYSLSKYFNNDPKHYTKISFIYYLCISLLDALTVIISYIGLTKTTGNIQSFIIQLSIPINMFFCFLILNYRYHLLNYIGVALIVLTISLVEIKTSFDSQKENSIIYNLVFMSSLIPLCFSNITKEIIFKKHKISIPKLNAWVSLFQILTSCLILPIYSLPLLKQTYIPFSGIFTNIKNGLACLFLGKNTITESCGVSMDVLCDKCNGAWKIFITYSFFNICDNLISCYIINEFSTVTYSIISCIQGPAITIAYYFKFLAGDVMRKPQVVDFVTLIGYLIGSIFYRAGNIILENKKLDETEEDKYSDEHLIDDATCVTN